MYMVNDVKIIFLTKSEKNLKLNFFSQHVILPQHVMKNYNI